MTGCIYYTVQRLILGLQHYEDKGKGIRVYWADVAYCESLVEAHRIRSSLIENPLNWKVRIVFSPARALEDQWSNYFFIGKD